MSNTTLFFVQQRKGFYYVTEVITLSFFKKINYSAIILLLVIIVLWEISVYYKWLPAFVIPSPSAIFQALLDDWQNLLRHTRFTMIETILGLFIGIALALGLAILMDQSERLREAVYPILITSQTIPTVAIAPILVIWLGYGMLPKIVLVILTTLFPIVISLMNGFKQADTDTLRLIKLMGASSWQLLRHVKLPSSLPYFFSGLKISVAYAFVSAVIAEWLGGFDGLGVYMLRLKNAFNYPGMFAVILLISLVSLLLLACVNLLEYFAIPWQHLDKKENQL